MLIEQYKLLLTNLKLRVSMIRRSRGGLAQEKVAQFEVVLWLHSKIGLVREPMGVNESREVWIRRILILGGYRDIGGQLLVKD